MKNNFQNWAKGVGYKVYECTKKESLLALKDFFPILDLPTDAVISFGRWMNQVMS